MPLTSLSKSGGRGRPTMREVAALAGVSVKTVSRVVNDEPGVSPDVRDRVRAAVERLDYHPNLAASNLRRAGGTATIGALVQDLSNSFSAGMLRAIDDEARGRGTALLTASLDEAPDREEALVASLVRRRVDGLIIVPATKRQDYLASELRAGMPVVMVDRAPRGIDVDSVSVDNAAGAALAVGHLLDQGHRRLGIITDVPEVYTARMRREGVRTAYADRGIGFDEGALHAVRTEEEARALVHDVMAGARPPTGIFAARNVIAVGAARALSELGLRERVALVGFDDFPLADLLDPPLTVVRQNSARIGHTAATMLFERIAGESCAPRHVVFDCELIVRGSGEIAPAE